MHADPEQGGATRVLYDPTLSNKGALLSAPRAKARREAASTPTSALAEGCRRRARRISRPSPFVSPRLSEF